MVHVEEAAPQAAAVHLPVRRHARLPQQRGRLGRLAAVHQAPVPPGEGPGVEPAERTLAGVSPKHHAPGVAWVAAHLMLVHTLPAAEGAAGRRHRLLAPAARKAGAARQPPPLHAPLRTHQSTVRCCNFLPVK